MNYSREKLITKAATDIFIRAYITFKKPNDVFMLGKLGRGVSRTLLPQIDFMGGLKLFERFAV